jgi:hypothetical protein
MNHANQAEGLKERIQTSLHLKFLPTTLIRCYDRQEVVLNEKFYDLLDVEEFFSLRE